MQRLSLLLAAAAATLAFGCRDTAGYRCESCNVVLVSLDTVRADHIGAYGYERPTTPNLDALAAAGVVFENAISQSSWTRPAHMSMMTGRHPNEHGFVGLNDRKRIDASSLTLASALRAHGYATAAFTGGVNVAAAYGFDVGFDVFRSNGRMFRDNLEETRYWLDELATEPFFLFWHGYDAHTPYTSDPVDRAALGLPTKRRRMAIERICRRKRAGQGIRRVIGEYDASIHRADRYLGKLIAELKRRGLYERTLILVLSDHGEEFLEHGACFHLNTLYREVLHVPFVLRAPGLPSRRVGALVPACVSVARTILDLVGIDGLRLPGMSLAAAASGGAVPDEPVVSETRHRRDVKGGRGHLRSLTLSAEKLIDWITLEQREWFDLEHDPKERTPRTAGAGVERASRQLAEWLERHSDKPRPTAGEMPPSSDEESERNAETERELRALGYLD